MARLTLFRNQKAKPSDADLERARYVVFGMVDGLGQDDKRGWRHFWRRIAKLEPGEILEFETRFLRNGKHHRLFFAMITAVYDSQERFTDFEQFRHWLLINAGHVTWAAGAKGGVVPLAKSISYSKADEEEFITVHEKVLDFLRGNDCAPFLWPHLKGQDPFDMMEGVLDGFERNPD